MNTNPIIKSYEHIISYEKHNGKVKKTINLTKKLKGKKYIIKGNINGNPIKITKKVRFPPNIISPNKGMITSKKNSFKPKSILRNKTEKKRT